MGIFSTKGKKSKEGPDSDKKKTQLLQEFELKYHKLIDTANYAIFIADAKTGFILDANKKAGELIGVSPDRIIGMHQSKLHPPEEAKHYKKIFQEHIKSGKSISEELFVIHKSGEKIPVEISASVVEIGGKRIIQGIFRDVTERKKAEDTVKKSKETLSTFMNSAPDVFALFDSELNLIDINRAGLMMLPQGTKKEDAIGKNITEFYSTKDKNRFDKYLEVMKTGKTLFIEDIVPGYELGDLHLSVRAFKMGEGLGLIVTDITNRKKVEDKLAKSEKKFRNLTDNALVGVYQTNLKGDILYVNDALVKIAGARSPAEMKSINISMKYKDPKVREKLIRLLKKEGRVDNFAIEVVNEKEDSKSLLISSTLEEDVISGVMMDMTERKKAEEKMVSLSRFPEENPLPVLRIAKDGTVLYSNEAGQSVLKHFRSEVGGPIKGELKNSVVRAYKSGKNDEIEVKYDNKVFLLDIVIGADVDYVNLYGSDITENKKAEEEVKSSHKRLLSILDGINALVYVTDMQTYELLFVNKYGRDVWGDVDGKICWETLQEGQSGPCSFCTNKYLVDKKGNPTRPYEWEFKNTINNKFYFIIDRAIEWYDGRIVRLEIATDITERKKADELLRESEEKFENAFEHASIGRVIADPQGNFIMANKSYCKLSGYTKKEVLSKTWMDLTLPEDMGKSQNNVKMLFEGKIPSFRLEERLIRKDGSHLWIDLNVVLTRDQDGVPKYMIGDVIDITERKIAEEAIEKIFNMTGYMVCTADLVGNFTRVNKSFEEILGYTSEELLGQPYLNLIHPEDRQKTLDIIDNEMAKGIKIIGFENRYRCKDGTYKWLSWTAQPDPKTGVSYAIAYDITESKKVEETMHESEEKFRTLAEKSPNMIFINYQGKVVFANEKCEELMGYSKEEFYSPEFDFISLIAPEDKELIMDSFKRHMKGEEVKPYEYSLIARNGKRIDALQTSKLIEYAGGTALLGIITDISERKKSEKELEEKVDELEKWQKLTVGRELRMTNLKEEIEELKKRLKKYEYS